MVQLNRPDAPSLFPGRAHLGADEPNICGEKCAEWAQPHTDDRLRQIYTLKTELDDVAVDPMPIRSSVWGGIGPSWGG
jgi:hypothetical protein